jgi:hypothetical protein
MRKRRRTPVPLERTSLEIIYTFLRDMVGLFDGTSIVTFILYTFSIYTLLGLEASIALAFFFLVRGAGHFWALRHYHNYCKSIRFLPLLGGYIETFVPFCRRRDEGFSALGASIFVLMTSLVAFGLYITTGNLFYLFYASIAFGVNLLALLPIGVDLDGTAVLKSITFSIGRHLGLFFMFANIFAIPGFFYWLLSRQGPVDMAWLSPMVIAGVQRFTEEYRVVAMKPMSGTEIRNLAGLYLGLFIAFLFLPIILNISSINNSQQAEIASAVNVGMIGLMLISVAESNIIFFIEQKRRIFG